MKSIFFLRIVLLPIFFILYGNIFLFSVLYGRASRSSVTILRCTKRRPLLCYMACRVGCWFPTSHSSPLDTPAGTQWSAFFGGMLYQDTGRSSLRASFYIFNLGVHGKRRHRVNWRY